MPKLKTHRGAAKRFKKTGTGKIVRASAFKRHILTSKTTKSKRHMRGTRQVAERTRRSSIGCCRTNNGIRYSDSAGFGCEGSRVAEDFAARSFSSADTSEQ